MSEIKKQSKRAVGKAGFERVRRLF